MRLICNLKHDIGADNSPWQRIHNERLAITEGCSKFLFPFRVFMLRIN